MLRRSLKRYLLLATIWISALVENAIRTKDLNHKAERV